METTKNQHKTNSVFVIMRRELAAYFTNPAAYIVTGAFLLLSGVFFFLTFFIEGRAELRTFFALLPFFLMIFVPPLTMRLFSEELRSGSFETLMTLPVNSAQVVLGKFLAAVATSAIMIAPTIFYVITACVFGKPDFGPIIGGYIGAFFLCAVYSSIGIFSSALTKNQIIAFFTALAISVGLTLVGMLLVFLPPPFVRFFSWLAIITHFQPISRGIADSRDVVYFVTITLVFLLFTERRFAAQSSLILKNKVDSALFLVILLLVNLVSSRAFLRSDLTSSKMYSISKVSKDLVSTLPEPLSVNVFFSSDLPAPYNSVEQYVRDLLVEYKAAANSNFNYTMFDMNKADNEDAARSYGLNQIQVQKVETTEVQAKAVWMGLAIVYGDNIKTFDNLNTPTGLEYKLTTAISKMISASDSLAALKQTISITLYPGRELIPYGIADMEKLEDTFKDAVRELNKKYNDSLVMNVFELEADEKTLTETHHAVAEKYGIQLVEYETEEGAGNKATTVGIVVELQDQFRIVPLSLQNFFGWRLIGADNLDSRIAGALESVLSKTVQVGYVRGHNELELFASPFGGPNHMNAENFLNVVNDIYSLVDVTLVDGEIPLNMRSIMINSPREEFTEEELFALDQFVMRGGNLLICLDPLIEGMGDGGPNAPPDFAKPVTNLDKLLDTYGIKPAANFVMDERGFVSNQEGRPVKLEWAPQLTYKSLDSKNPITKDIGQLTFLLNGSIDISGAVSDPDLNTTVLAKSSPRSWTVDENIVLYPGLVVHPTDESLYGENNLAVLVEGKFKSAFAGETPDFLNAPQNASGIQARQKIEKGIQNAKVIFISSGLVTTQQLIDEEGRGTMAFFMRNVIDYLNGAEDFCEMRTKGTSRNLLDVRNVALALIFRMFNQFGLTILVIIAGLFVWRLRSLRKNEIYLKYNPKEANDENNNNQNGE